MFEPCVDLLAQFFSVATQTFCLLAEPLQFPEPQIVGHAPSVRRVRGFVTEKPKLDGTIRVKSSRALAVHYLRREFAGLGQIDEVDRHRIGFGEMLKVEQFAANAKNIHALEERGGRLAFFLFALVKRDQPLERFRNASRRNLRSRPRKARAAFGGRPTHHDEVLRYGLSAYAAHAALEADRGDVMLTTPVRAAADLDVRAVGRGNEIRPPAQMLFKETA